MVRTVEDVLVFGRTIQEIKAEVFRWMDEWGIKKEEERDDFVRGRMGIPGGLGLTAPKYFEISYRPSESGILVHTEGWIGIYGVSESSFSKDALLGGIPRRKGWKTIEQLWNRLKLMSNPTSPVVKQIITCPKCGGPLTYIEQYKRWYCYSCQEYLPEP